MRIHHLNCGTLRPFGRRRINGDGLPFQAGRLVCHCLLIETDRRLVLVDTGFGLDDIAEGRQSLVRPFLFPNRLRGDAAQNARLKQARDAYTRFLTRARFDPDETAVGQLARLGHSADGVTDIVLTHLDLDHAGGLRDFPTARVHVHQAEYAAAMSASTSLERFRYWTHQWSHGPDWVTYGSTEGDSWFGFDGVRELQDLPELALVPLPGHTRGHAVVAVRLADTEPRTAPPARWLLHAGDAYFFHGEVDAVAPRSTRGLAGFQARFQVDGSARHRNQDRLRALAAAHSDQIEMFCSHDPVEFERFRSQESSEAQESARASCSDRPRSASACSRFQ
jgi:glyoxylase-like metal-dependent hydrolase (beta-lactamase superfamily II)